MREMIECVAFDADDTLWENEEFYAKAEQGLADILSDIDECEVFNKLTCTEMGNMKCLGYGAKAMTLSMIETAIALKPNIDPRDILRIIQLGKELLEVPTEMRPDAERIIAELRKKYRVIIITKGELNEQQRKFDNSPLDKGIDYFILDDKTPEQYRRLLAHENIDIKSLVMVGNSPKSDILPILEMGGYAIYIPSIKSWALENALLPKSSKLRTIDALSAILDIL